MDIIATLKADLAAAPRGEMMRELQRIADASGVNPKVLRNIIYEVTTYPRYNNIQKLQDYYARKVADD